jgi:hypothetical protein
MVKLLDHSTTPRDRTVLLYPYPNRVGCVDQDHWCVEIPGRSRGLPPVSTLLPAATVFCTSRSRSRTPSGVESGLSSVLSSNGSPTFSAAIFCAKTCSNLSAMPSATINRFASPTLFFNDRNVARPNLPLACHGLERSESLDAAFARKYGRLGQYAESHPSARRRLGGTHHPSRSDSLLPPK